MIPYLYNAAECWVELPKEALATLNSLQELFMRSMLATPRTCPIVAMYWSLAAPLAENRIIEYKLRFFHHLVHLNHDSIAYRIYLKQRNMKVPSLVRECLEFLAILNIKESEVISSSKFQWAKLLSLKVKEKNRGDILEKMKTYKKFDYFQRKDEVFEMKEYFKVMKLEDSRIKFSLESKMTRTVRTHFFGDKNYAEKLWVCQNCEKATDSISHLKVCPSFAHLRENRDFNCDLQLTDYFKEIVKQRMDEDE